MNDARVQRVVAALARGVLGSAYDAEVPGRVVEAIDRLWARSISRRLMGTMRALDTRAGALALTGSPTPVSWLSADDAEAVVQRWKTSRIGSQRDLASTIVALSTAQAYGYPGPQWERIGYPGPLGAPPKEPRRLEPMDLDEDAELNCDVVIVGSGAGGGCVAGVLAQRGLDVVVLEKGSYYNESDFDHVSAEAFKKMYLNAGVFTTTDLGVRILSGSTLGGGTTINWSTSWKTPRPVLEEWAGVSGIDAFVSGEIEESLDEVAQRLDVNFDSSAAAKRDELLEEGLKRLGWHVDAMPRCVKNCAQDERCGYCCYGCRLGAKRSTLRTYLEDAAAAGARIVCGADVRRVVIEDRRAVGVEGRIRGTHKLRVNAVAVVAACGSIETPALLLRSGMKGRVGRNLMLHPGTALGGVFDDDVRMWEGVMQGRYSAEMGGPWTGGYGVTMESGPLHPHEWAVAVPWTSAADHARRMSEYVKTSHIALLSRDTARGRVRIDRGGAPKVEYAISASDQKRIADAVVAGGAVLAAAGAREVYTTHRTGAISFVPNGNGAHEAWADEVRSAGFASGDVVYASMHQMGSCGMGVDPARSVVDANNEAHDVKGLYVVDGSTFPTPSGVNPMLSIYGIANRAAKKIAERLS